MENISNKEEKMEYDYQSLGPIESIGTDDPYLVALKWAMDNRIKNDIRNIALTGPYGSGKSSILKSFQKNNTDKNLHFLNISLATFKEEVNTTSNSTKEELLRTIELSILQQILYHEKDELIPDSRFSKIKSLSNETISYITALLVLAILSLLYVIDYSIILDFLWNPAINLSTIIYTRYISIAFLSVCFVWACYKSIRLFRSLQINKFNFHNAEIELGNKTSKSILNQNLEEILYFFEVTRYNVVVIEDLDRFQQTEIFTKLREINLLINTSKKINKKVVFIYAVRDEMFKDSDRTKFFDFIVPIIPPINTSNSNEVLTKKLADRKISNELIEDISLFISDLRLLNNILNEYNIYNQKLDKNLTQNNLLAIIVYKNLMPDDFVKLAKQEGELYFAIKSKSNYIESVASKYEEEKKRLHKRIEDIESIRIKDIKELRKIYLLHIIFKSEGFQHFRINNEKCTVVDAAEDSNFEYVRTNKSKYQRFEKDHYSRYYENKEASFSFKFTEIENEISAEPYSTREKAIIDWSNNEAKTLRQKIVDIDNKIIHIKKIKITELLNDKNANVKIDSQLINLLLRRGYINEDYLDYISIFHEGSLTKQDNTFLLRVKTQTLSDFDYKLSNVNNLIKKISSDEYRHSYILNFDLIDTLLLSENNNDAIYSLFQQLSNESEKSVRFFERYIERGINTEPFVESLCDQWDRIVGYVEQNNLYSQEFKDKIIWLVLNNAKTETLERIAKNSTLTRFLSLKEEFSSYFINKEKAPLVTDKLSIKFQNLSNPLTEDAILAVVTSGNHYEINIKMLEFILKGINAFDQIDFDTKNYELIKRSNNSHIISYIEENIGTYIEDVYLKLPPNNLENIENTITLLNNPKVSINSKEEIIKRTQHKLPRIDNNVEVNELLLKNNKTAPKWEAILKHVEESGNIISEGIVTFLNIPENTTSITKNIFPLESTSYDTSNNFRNNVLKTNQLSDNVYIKLINSLFETIDYIDVTNLNSVKIKLLLDSNKLFPNNNVFEALRNKPNFHIELLLKHKEHFITHIDDYTLTIDDLYSLTDGTNFTPAETYTILNHWGISFITKNPRITNKVYDILLNHISINTTNELLLNLLEVQSVDAARKTKLLLLKNTQLDELQIQEAIISIEDGFRKSIIDKEATTVDNTPTNKELATLLRKRNLIKDLAIKKNSIHVTPLDAD